jgi:hypothetical protein
MIVDGVAHHAIWIAGVLFAISIVCWSLPNLLNPPATAVDSPVR